MKVFMPIFIALMFWGSSGNASDLGRIRQNLEQGCFTTSECVAALYRNVLRRRPDKEGLSYWTQAVEAGEVTLDDVARTMGNSPESRGEVDGYFRRQMVRQGYNPDSAYDASEFSAENPSDADY